MNHIYSLILGTTLALSSFTAFSADKANVKDIDCAELIEQDYSVVPVIIGYIVSANSIVEIDQLDPVEVDDIVAECQKAPKSKVSDVVNKAVKK